MDGKAVAVKLEKNLASSNFGDNFHGGFPPDNEKGSLGFTEMLALPEYTNPYLLDMVTAVQLRRRDCSDSFATNHRQPGTPNSSISSASSDAVNDEARVKSGGVEGGEQEQKSANKQLKVKKTSQKKQKQPRFAFMTKSEVDHLEDGYRWRKYGQKAVKNSPYPRSYYRCTTASCNVKKRVERSFSDPSVVVTTYEGQHTHTSPIMTRPAYAALAVSNGCSAAGPFGFETSPLAHHRLPSSLFSAGYGYNAADVTIFDEKRFAGVPHEPGLFKDHGLLQDLVPSHVFKEEC